MENDLHHYVRRTVFTIARDASVRRGVIRLAKKVAAKLNEEIARGHSTGPFMLSLGMAIMSDLIGYADNGIIFVIQSVPLAGQAIGFLVGFGLLPATKLFLAVTLYLMMRKNGFMIKRKLKFVYWSLSFLACLPAIDMLPWETIAIMYTWRRVKERAKAAQETLNKVNALTAAELRAIEEDVGVIDDFYSDRTYYGRATTVDVNLRGKGIIKGRNADNIPSNDANLRKYSASERQRAQKIAEQKNTKIYGHSDPRVAEQQRAKANRQNENFINEQKMAI